MEEMKKKPKLPSNYVSLLQRREWWMQRQHQPQQQQSQQQQQQQEERETQNKVKIDGEKKEEEKQNHNPQQPQQQQQQEEQIKENKNEETETITGAVKDDGGESSVTAEVGAKKKGNQGKNNGNKRKEKEKEKEKEEKEKEEEVKEIEIRANGEANDVEEDKEERVAARENHAMLAYVVKGEKESVVFRRDGRKKWSERKRTMQNESRPTVRGLVEGGNVVERKLENMVEAEVEGNVEDEKVDERHRRLAYGLKRGKERVVSGCKGRKREEQLEFRPKTRNLVEGSHFAEEIEQKPDNVVEESSMEAEVGRNVEDEARIEFEEGGVVEESDLAEEVGSKLSGVSVDEGSRRHVRHTYDVKEKKERVGSRRNVRKRETGIKSRQKVRDLVEGSSFDVEIELKLDNLVQESSQEVEVERNVEDEKVGVECEVVEESELVPEVEQKLGVVSVDEESEWSGRRNGVRRNLGVGHKGYVSNNMGYRESQDRFNRGNRGYYGHDRESQGRFNRGNRGYYGHDREDNRKKVPNLGRNARPGRGGDGRGNNGGMVWVKKEEPAVDEGHSSN